VLPKSREDEIGFPFRRQTSKTDQENPLAGPLLAEDELSEILVTGDKESARLARQFQDEFVTDSRVKLSDVGNFKPIQAKSVNDLSIDAFVGDELQAAS
jgi:hypothetical protein